VKHSFTTRLISFVLSLLMVFGMLPLDAVHVHATENHSVDNEDTNLEIDYKRPPYKVDENGDPVYDENGNLIYLNPLQALSEAAESGREIDYTYNGQDLTYDDFYSDDYCTYAFNYSAEGGLKTLNFKNVNRGEAEEGYCDNGYGMVTAVDGDSIILTGSQDVLGTWMASRTFSLQNGQFETADDGYFRMLDITADAEIWEYFCLIPTVEIAAKFSDGSEGKIMPGEKFVVTMSDRTSTVHFETQDGKTGSFEIAPNDEYGWGSLIGGVSEDECFEYCAYPHTSTDGFRSYPRKA